MQQHPSDNARNAQQRALLILDIDETLIHATGNPLPDRRPDFTFGPYSVYCRPHLQDFLAVCAEHYDLAVWSSGGCDYVAAVVERIFPDSILPLFVWSRDRCTPWTDPETRDTCFLKDLRKVKQKGFDLRRVLIVEDTPGNVRRHYGNAVYVSSWTGDTADRELENLASYLVLISAAENVRSLEKRGWRQRAGGGSSIVEPQR